MNSQPYGGIKPRAWRRVRVLWSCIGAALIGVGLLVTQGGQGAAVAGQVAMAPQARLAAGQTASPAQGLKQRCEQAMVLGRCRVMSPSAPVEAASRVFIAGTGEVDAVLYAELRRQGDAMCGDVARHCEADWQGRACQIARSLYPVTAAAP